MGHVRSLIQHIVQLTEAAHDELNIQSPDMQELLQAMEGFRARLEKAKEARKIEPKGEIIPTPTTRISDLARTPLPFLHQIGMLKHLPRTGWLRFIDRPESVASHSFRVAMAGLLAPPGLDRQKCAILGLVHDLAESVIGDVPTWAAISREEKHSRELRGFHYLQSLLEPYDSAAARGLVKIWEEYEYGSSPEARFIKEMDKFDCLVQAHEYEQQTFLEKDLAEFQGLREKITSKGARAWLDALDEERKAHFSKRQRRLPVLFVVGDPNVVEPHCDYLSSVLNIRQIALEGILRDESTNPTGSHACFLRQCLEDGTEIPVPLEISLLEDRINNCVEGGDCCLVRCFPSNLEQLIEFERRVQRPNHCLLLTSSCDEAHAQNPAGHLTGYLQAKRYGRYYDVEKWEYPANCEGAGAGAQIKVICCDGPASRVREMVREAVEELCSDMQHWETRTTAVAGG